MSSSRQSPLIVRVLPFALPSLIALVVIGWISHQNAGSPAPAVAVKAPAAKRVGATKSAALAELRDSTRPSAAMKADATPPPKDPRVAILLEKFSRGDRAMPQLTMQELVRHPVGKRVSVAAGGIEWSGIVDSRLEEGGSLHIGVTLDGELGRFQFSQREDGRVRASLMFTGESHALAFRGYPNHGAWKMEATTVDHILCVANGSVYPLGRNEAMMPFDIMPENPASIGSGPQQAPPILNSNPGSSFVIYCDFDGETVTHPLWNDGKTINALPHSRANDVVFVTRVWKRTSEDFAPFDVNVTTDRAVYDAAPVTKRVQCVITPTNDAAPGSGGVAYLNSFGDGTPCWAFNPSEDTCAETISHEIGHTLGLRHDGTTKGVTYYGGHGSGLTSWAPIMGAFFADINPPYVDDEFTQWSKGEYPDANNKEDDLLLMTSNNGFGYRIDDKGNDIASATPMVTFQDQATDSGIIERTDDQDWLSFYTVGGDIQLNVQATDVNSSEVPQRGSNLAVSLELYDAAGTLLATSNPVQSMDATISRTVVSGDYYLKIDGAGRGDLATGFSDYASLGQYTISGTIPWDPPLSIEPSSKDFTYRAGSSSVAVTTEFDWSWSTPDDWIHPSGPIDRTGSQTLTYSVDEYTGIGAPRIGTIVFTCNEYSVAHKVTQQPGDFQISITSIPLSVTAGQEDAANMEVKAVAKDGVLSYQWKRNGLDIPGATSEVLAIGNIQLADVGSYTVMVSNSNSGGVVNKLISVVATLRVIPTNRIVTPAITSDLSALSLAKGVAMTSYTITANTYTSGFVAKGLPKGLKLNSKTGVISGKPTKAGQYLVTLQAKSKSAGTAVATKLFTVL